MIQFRGHILNGGYDVHNGKDNAAPATPVIRKKEERPEAADHSKSKTRNQRLIDFLRSTADIDPPDKTEQGDCRGTIIMRMSRN